MCGIAGVVGGGADVRRMTARLAHRGPDDERFHEDVLGFRRLAILDLEGGAQPMKGCGDAWLVFNGEIYNFRELRDRLRGHAFKTRSDAEVLLHLYEDLGEDCVRELDGMFAFAIWDGRRLFAARDRLGKKPFVYRHEGSRFHFASEIAALDGPRRLDRLALEHYLAFGVVPAPLTILEGVRKLPPGHSLVFEGTSLRVRRWWEPATEQEEGGSEGEWAGRVRESLRAAVAKRLIADVPVGAFLSGGLDSSAVVAFMPRPARTFTAAVEEMDESAGARETAAALGTEHREFKVATDAAEALRTLVERFGEPFGDPSCIPTYRLARETARHVKVVLSGDGGDELFGGYRRYAAIAGIGRLRGLPAPLRSAAAWLLRPWGGPDGERVRRMLRQGDAPLSRVYAGLMNVFTPERRRALGLPGEDVEARLCDLFERRGGGSGAAAFTDLQSYLPDDLLVKVDIASMANGLEVRCPFLDRDLVDLALRMPDRLRRGKRVLRKAVEGLLPASVLRRPKRGFGVPLAGWFRGPLRPLLEDGLRSLAGRGWVDPAEVARLREEHQSGAADHAQRLFLLLVLALWGDTFQRV